MADRRRQALGVLSLLTGLAVLWPALTAVGQAPALPLLVGMLLLVVGLVVLLWPRLDRLP